MKNYLYIAYILVFAGCAHDPNPQMLADDTARSQHTNHGWGCDAQPDQRGCGHVVERAETAVPTFIEDDYPRALAEAKAKGLPIFVDAWASWCHSCVSLKQFVFKDPLIADETAHFVWLAIDTENPKNADFIAKFPSAVLPTLRVIDPASETESLKWEGTLTAKELIDTLDYVRVAGSGNADASRARREDAEVMGLALRGENDACAKRAAQLIGHLPNGTQRVDVAVTGTSCALELSKSEQQATLPVLVAELQKITGDLTLPILADDRSSAFEALVDAGQAAGEKTAMRENAVLWATFLEGEAKKAKTPAERAVFDPHRLLAYLALGQPERAVPMLQESQKDFPGDFNPRARLARAYLELGKLDEAIAESDQALALANGPRRVRIALVKADALAKKGDAAAEKKTLEDTLAFVGTLPAPQASAKMKSALQDRIAKLDAAIPPKGKKLPAKR